jgi:hypothetical protein
MLADFLDSSIRVVRGIAVLAFASSLSFGQAAAGSSQAAGGDAAACARLADIPISVNSTLEAKVDGLDSAHMKPGKDVWFRVARGVMYRDCTLDTDAVVYARIISVNSTKNPDSSELSLSFDRADCSGKDKRPFKLRLVAIVGPQDQTKHMHNNTPTEVSGSGREINSAAVSSNGLDVDLDPGGPANTVHPGIVVGVKNVKLEPVGGPQCSDKLTSTKSKVQIEPGSELILALTQTQ